MMNSPPLNTPPAGTQRVWRWYAGYLLFTALLFNEVILKGWRFIGRDQLHFFFPLGTTIREAFFGGGSLLWDRSMDAGLPFLARGSPTVLYPTTLLHAVMSPESAMAAAILLHFVLAAICTFHLALRYVTLPAAAWIAGLSYAFGGYCISMVGGGFYLFGAALLPLSLLAFLRLMDSPGIWRMVQWAAVLAVQLFSMEAQTLYYELLVVCPTLMVVHATTARHRLIAATAAGGAGVLALGLSCSQWWPTVEFLGLSIRSAGIPLNHSQAWSLHPYRLMELIVPYFFGGYLPESNYWARSLITAEKGVSWAYCLHVGMVALIALSAISFKGPGRRAAIAWTGLGVFFLVCAFGIWTPFHAALLRFLPGASTFRYPEKFLVFFSMALCILGAMGIERFLTDHAGRRRRAFASLGLLSMTLIGLRLWFAPERSGALDWMKAMVEAQGASVAPALALESTANALTRAFAVAMVLLLLFSVRRWLRPGIFAACLVLAAAVDLFSAGVQLRIIGPSWFFDTPPALCQFFAPPDHGLKPTVWRDPRLRVKASKAYRGILDADLLPQRTSEYDTLIPNVGSAWCVSYAYGYESAKLTQNTLVAKALGTQRKRFMDIFGVSYIIARPGDFDESVFPTIVTSAVLDLVIHENHPLPYAYAVGTVDSAGGHQTAINALARPDYDYRARAILETPVALPQYQEGRRMVRLDHHAGGAVQLAVSFEAPGYVVVLETYYPGWQATVDGGDVPIFRSNGMFIGIPVPVGEHEIRLSFDPPRQRLANLVSAATLALCLAGAFVAVRRGRRHDSPGAENP